MSPRKGRGAGDGNGTGTNGDVAEPTEDQLAALELEEEFDEELEFAAEDLEAEEHGEKRHNVFIRLYRGETSFDFIGRRRWWFLASAIVILLGVISLSTRGLNLGIDFKGGQSWLVTTNTLTVAEATSTAEAAGLTNPTVVQLTNQINHTRQIEVTADLNSLPVAQQHAIENKVINDLAAGGPYRARQRQLQRRRPDLGWAGHLQGHRGPHRLLHRRDHLHLDPVRIQDGRGRHRGRAPRHPGHGRASTR